MYKMLILIYITKLQIFKYSKTEWFYQGNFGSFFLSLLTVTCLTLKMYLINKHNSPLMRMFFSDIYLSLSKVICPLQRKQLWLCLVEKTKLCFSYWPSLGKTLSFKDKSNIKAMKLLAAIMSFKLCLVFSCWIDTTLKH